MRASAAAILVAVLGLSGLPAACWREQACTLIGCQDQATVVIRRPGGQLPQVDLTVELDGQRFDCPAPSGPNAFARCNDRMFVTTQETQDCRETRTGDNVTLSCVPTGRFEQTLEITGTPTSLKVSARQAGAAVGEKTFTPQYQTVQPNGPGCEPTCRQWSGNMEVP